MAALRDRHLVFHGLRKSAVVFLLEAGCTDAETAAITGQSRDMVENYAKQVNQKRLAAAAILKWEGALRRAYRPGHKTRRAPHSPGSRAARLSCKDRFRPCRGSM